MSLKMRVTNGLEPRLRRPGFSTHAITPPRGLTGALLIASRFSRSGKVSGTRIVRFPPFRFLVVLLAAALRLLEPGLYINTRRVGNRAVEQPLLGCLVERD